MSVLPLRWPAGSWWRTPALKLVSSRSGSAIVSSRGANACPVLRMTTNFSPLASATSALWGIFMASSLQGAGGERARHEVVPGSLPLDRTGRLYNLLWKEARHARCVGGRGRCDARQPAQAAGRAAAGGRRADGARL